MQFKLTEGKSSINDR